MEYDNRKQEWTRCTAANPVTCTNHSVHQGQQIGIETIEEIDNVKNPYNSN